MSCAATCRHGNFHYTFNSEPPLNFFPALNNCTTEGGSLAIIRDIDTWNAIRDCCHDDDDDYWIGLRQFKGQPLKWTEDDAAPLSRPSDTIFKLEATQMDECVAASVRLDRAQPRQTQQPVAALKACATPNRYICQTPASATTVKPSSQAARFTRPAKSNEIGLVSGVGQVARSDAVSASTPLHTVASVSGKSNDGLAAGVAFALLFAILAIAAVWFLRCTKRGRRLRDRKKADLLRKFAFLQSALSRREMRGKSENDRMEDHGYYSIEINATAAGDGQIRPNVSFLVMDGSRHDLAMTGADRTDARRSSPPSVGFHVGAEYSYADGCDTDRVEVGTYGQIVDDDTTYAAVDDRRGPVPPLSTYDDVIATYVVVDAADEVDPRCAYGEITECETYSAVTRNGDDFGDFPVPGAAEACRETYTAVVRKSTTRNVPGAVDSQSTSVDVAPVERRERTDSEDAATPDEGKSDVTYSEIRNPAAFEQFYSVVKKPSKKQ